MTLTSVLIDLLTLQEVNNLPLTLPLSLFHFYKKSLQISLPSQVAGSGWTQPIDTSIRVVTETLTR